MQTQEIKILSPLEKVITEQLDKNLSGHQTGEGDAWWTREVKKHVCGAVKEFNNKYKVYYSVEKNRECDDEYKNRDGGEWLFDLIVLDCDNDNVLSKVPLVLESEWKGRSNKELYKKNIRDDFEKLLVARAEHRVIIFESDNNDEKEEIIRQLRNFIEQFKDSKKDDRYLFACCKKNKNVWKFDFLVYVVSK